MRKIPAALVVLALTAVGLVGCSAAGADACPRPSDPDPGTMSAVTVTGDTADAPRLDLYTPFHAAGVAFEDLSTAEEGTPVTSDDQLVVLDVSLFSGTTGELLVKTAYDGSDAAAFSVSRWETTFPQLGEALQCARPGTRMAVALPPDGIAPEAAPSLGIAEGESAVLVVDVRKTYLAAADGADQYNDALGLPTVVRAPDGRPGIIVPDAAAPTNTVTQIIKKGDGEVVSGDSPVRLAYTGVSWDSRDPFTTTWGDEPQSVTLEAMGPAFASAITGKTVGSQILVVIPPDQVGDAQTGAPADATLVYVVDILGIDSVPAR